MDIREITPRYHVSPQIDPMDAPAIKDAGYSLVICNRPDSEIPPSHQAIAMEAALTAAGVPLAILPLTHQTMTPENVAKQAALIEEASGPVLAYCASGTRSSVIWAFGQAGEMDVDDILGATTRAGYALDGLRPQLEMIAAQKA